MASASHLNRRYSRRPVRSQRPQCSHEPSAQSSGSGPHEAHEPAEGGVRPALDPAQREDGLLLRPHFEEEEAGDAGAELKSIRLSTAHH
jgi:hypothetical protein